MRELENEEYKVCLDYAVAYGNLGEEAMLLSAIDRISRHLGRCRFIIPVRAGQPMPDLPTNVQIVNTPRRFFRMAGRLARIFFRLVGHLPYVKRFVPSESREFDALVWKNADRIANLTLPLLMRLPCSFSRTVDKLKTCDILYTVGAGSLNDFNLTDFAYKTWLYKTLRPCVKVSVASSQGIGPLNIQWARKKMKEALENLDFVSFRDYHVSESIIEELQPHDVKYSIVGDEAFSLRTGNEQELSDLLEQCGITEGESFVAFHFRATDCTQNTTSLYPKVAALLDALTGIIPHNFVFFPMSYHVHSQYDQQCGEAVRELMSKPERLLLAPLCKDVRIVKGAIGKAKYSLGLSYHVHVFSLSQGKPAVILYSGDYYKYKSEGLIGFYGEPCSALDLERVSLEEVLEAIQSLEDNYEAATARIAAVNTHIQDINDWHLREMKSKLTV